VRPAPLFLLLTALLLLGCAGQPLSPTLAARAQEVVLTQTATPPAAETAAPPNDLTPVAAPLGDEGEAGAQLETPGAVQTLAPPSVGTGVSPAQALQLRPPELGFEAPVSWRPPPVAVPFALHPDDHFYLARPLAPDARTYDLEWYPYGTQPMRAEALPYRAHHGMDFPNETGTPIFAAAAGTVIHAGPLVSPRDGVNYYGNTVVIQHDWQWQDQDVFTLYAHTLELFVRAGDRVEQGQLIAGVGASGEVSGPHLHLEVRVGENNYASTRNPALWLAPYDGWGVLAGRFIDSRGRYIHGALVTLIPDEIEGGFEMGVRRQRSYSPGGPNPDDVWQENFVVADLPAGEYTLVLATAGETFRRRVQVRPGQTNFIVVQADFEWSPTPVPTATPSPTPTVAPTPTAGP
jgi:murein DD-endopeptidase MepM/ murein hydrolase activator NlpD